MTHLTIHAGGPTLYKGILKSKFKQTIKEINNDIKLTALEKAEAREKARAALNEDLKNGYKNCY
mgnify:CR=1 FL=1